MTQISQAAPAPAAVEGAADNAPRKRILLVEGDGFTRLVLLLRLRLVGFDVDFTSNGTLGLGKLRNCHPDILLIELKLCGLSGLELLRAARAERGFADRPIYVFTHADRMNRATRKELNALSIQVLDKASVTREDLVQVFMGAFLRHEAVAPARGEITPEPEEPSEESKEIVPAAIEALVQGVSEQWQVVLERPEDRVANGAELLSRVSSLGSCAEAAGLADLARQAKALENLLQLMSDNQAYSDSNLEVVGGAVDVMIQLPFAGSGRRRRPTLFKALLVDESAPSIRVMEAALLKASFEVACFEDPGQARNFLNSNRASIVIANIALPEAHGLTPAELRRFPLHTSTHIIYGPERTPGNTPHDELPLRGSRLDRSRLQVAELVLRALNVVQGYKPVASKPAPAVVLATGAAVKTANHLAAVQGVAEDGFELFSIPRTQEASTRSEATADEASAAEHSVNQPIRLKELFANKGIPAQPIMRAEEAGPRGDDNSMLEATRLPEFAPDEILTDEQRLEAVPLTDGELQTPLAPEQDTPPDDSAATVAWTEEATDTTEPAQEPGTVFQETQFNEVVVTEGTMESIAPNGELMNNHLQAFADQRAQARCAELEEEVAALRQAFEGLNGAEQATAQPANDEHARELEQKLDEASGELAREREERQRAEERLKQKLEAAAAATQEYDVARQLAEGRLAEMEHQLNTLQQAKEAEARKSAENGSTGAAPSKRRDAEPCGMPASELEDQVRQGVAALAKATAELAKERGERQRSQQLAADLNARLQTMHQDFSRTLQAQGEHLSRITTLEQQHDQACQALERSTAELEQQEAERLTAEEELHKTKELNAQLRNDLSFFDGANKKFDGARQDLHTRLEASLNAVKEHEARLQQEKIERQRLAQTLEQTQAQLQDQVRKSETLEQELQSTREALQDRDTRLQRELTERQRLNEAIATTPHGSAEDPDRALEFSKVQSALQLEQVERKRQESQLVNLKQTAVDAAHSARSLRNSLRRQIREPVDNLVHSTRTLLELEMGEEQKRIAEAVLQDVLLVQTRLREPGLAQGEAADSAATSNSTHA
jgi:DNA-binding response OmpR family regulator